MSSRIHVSYTPVDHKRLGDVLSQYEHRSHQDLIADFESCLRDYTGKECVAVNCGTSAYYFREGLADLFFQHFLCFL